MIEALKSLIQNQNVDSCYQMLSDNPEVLDIKDENGATGFMLVAYSGDARLLELAVALKNELDFYEAIIVGDIELVKEYVEKNKEMLINSFSGDGFTPIALAAYFNQSEMVRFLFEMGADPNTKASNPSRVNALHAAVARENLALCGFLLDNGAMVDATQISGVTPLHSAVHRGNVELTKLILSYNPNVYLKMDNGQDALAIASNLENDTIKQILIHYANS